MIMTTQNVGLTGHLSAWFMVHRLARYNGVSMRKEYAYIKEKIEDAWGYCLTSSNARFVERWSLWFPEPSAPTVVQFLVTMKEAIVVGVVPPRLLDLRRWSKEPDDILYLKELKRPVGYNSVGRTGMCLKDRVLGLLILQKQAQLSKTSVRDVRKNVQRQLADEWHEIQTTDHSEYLEYWKARFSMDRPPTPEEYWLAVVDSEILSIVPPIPGGQK